jgi:hypothetical protein
MALYCGSFAGMVSPQIFNHYEVIVLGLICAFVGIILQHFISIWAQKSDELKLTM